jgi:sugar lactone lactonase YvrE
MITLSMEIACLDDRRYELGEHPQWIARSGTLQHVDIRGRTIVRHRLRDGHVDVRAVEDDVGFALPTRSGELLAGVGRTLVRLGDDGVARVVGDVGHEPAANRFNDARADPHGRVLAGTMSTKRDPGAAALYRVGESGTPRRVLSATLSNGLDWNLDATVLYYVDSTTQRVDAIAYDVDTGALGARRRLIEVAATDGLPDGLAVDAEGGIWLALFGGGRIRRYTPDGALDADIRLPVTNPTSLAFGGAALATLFVTTARHRLSPEQRRTEPLAGAVLSLRPGVAGRPSNLAA